MNILPEAIAAAEAIAGEVVTQLNLTDEYDPQPLLVAIAAIISSAFTPLVEERDRLEADFRASIAGQTRIANQRDQLQYCPPGPVSV